MITTTANEPGRERIVALKDMKRGEIGQIVNDYLKGEYVLCTVCGVVILSGSCDGWREPVLGAGNNVRILPSGSSVTLTVS